MMIQCAANRVYLRPEHLRRFTPEFLAARAAASSPIMTRLASAPMVPAVTGTEGDAPLADRQFPFVLSTNSTDRHGDQISDKGWLLGPYKQNPIVLANHDADLLPIGRASDVRIENGKLKATATLAPASVSPLAEHVRQLLLNGFLRACSVGFSPVDFELSKDPARPFGINFLRQELLEFSIVGIPSNRDCLLEGGPGNKSIAAAKARRIREAAALKLRLGV